MRLISLILLSGLFILGGCSSSRRYVYSGNDYNIRSRVASNSNVPKRIVDTKNIAADEVVIFAESLQGVPYKYGSADIRTGFDCSGFITYVFNHYNISVPRTSRDFTNAGEEVSIKESRRGDIILFTGSDAASGVVGHMGIITKNDHNKIAFIHSASGNGKGVVISGMNDYFVVRFVKVIRLFNHV